MTCENEVSYIWFFTKFKETFGETKNLVFVTDRHKAIENAFKVVYPNTQHGFCMYHISQIIKAKKFGPDSQIIPIFSHTYKISSSNT